MNDDTYGGELHAWIEPEIEARIVARILGEASDFEVDQLEGLMDERPELRIFMRRLEVVHGLMGDALKSEDDAKWRLAPERRAELMKAIGVAPTGLEQEADAADVLVLPIDDARERRVRRAGLKVALMAAACLMISVVIAPLFMKFGSKNGEKGAVMTDSKFFQMGADEEMESVILGDKGRATRRSELPAARGLVLERSAETNGRLSRTAGDGEPGSGSYRDRLQITDGTEGAHDKLAALKKSIGTVNEAIAVTEFDPPEIMNLPRTATAPASGPAAPPLVAGSLSDAKSEAAPVPKPAPAPSAKPTAPSASRPLAKSSDGPGGAPAPTSSIAKMTAAITPAPTAIPVPGAEVQGDIPVIGRLFKNGDDSFGSEDDFGSGWGSGGKGGGGIGNGITKSGADMMKSGIDMAGGVPLRTELPPELLEGTPRPIQSLHFETAPEPAREPVPPGEPVAGYYTKPVDRLESEKLAMDDYAATNTRQSGSSDSSWAYDGKDAEKDALLSDRALPMGNAGAIAFGEVGQTNYEIEPDYDQRANAEPDGEVAAAEAMFDMEEAGTGERFKTQLRLGTEVGESTRWSRDGAEMKELRAADEKPEEGTVLNGSGIIKGLGEVPGKASDPTDPAPESGEESLRGMVKREDGLGRGKSMARPAQPAAPADAAPAKEKTQMAISGGEKRDIIPVLPGMPIPQTDRKKPPSPDSLLAEVVDDTVLPDADMPVEAPAQARIKTKRRDVRQSNLEELGFDWAIQDEGKKANLKQKPGDGYYYRDYRGGTDGGESPDRPQTQEAIDANADQSGPAPGILPITGTFTDGPREQIQRDVHKEALKKDLSLHAGYGIGGAASDLDGDGRQAQVADDDESMLRERGAVAKEDNESRSRRPDEAERKNLDSAKTREVLEGQLELVEKRLEKMAQVVGDRRDVAVDKALESHDYFELDKEKQQLDLQIKRLLTLKGEDLDKDASGLQLPGNQAASHRRSSKATGGTAYLRNRLDAIVIPEIDFEDTTVEEALDFLRQRARELDTNELDPNKKGVNFVLRKGRVESAGQSGVDAELNAEGGLGGTDPGSARIKNLKLKNVTLGDALKHIEDQTGLRHKVDDYAVTLLPSGGSEGQDLLTRRWNVPPNFVKDIQKLGADENVDVDPFGGDLGGGGLAARRPMVDVLKDHGIRLPEGASATFLPGSNTLVVKSTPGELDKMDQIVEQIGEGSPPVDYMGLYEPLDSSGQLDQSNVRDEVVLEKLKNIRIPMVDFDGTTVEEAVDFLRQRTRELDVADAGGEAAGIDFSIRKPRIDTTARGRDAETAIGPVDPGQAEIKELKLRNVPVAVVLQYVADQAGLRYRVRNGTVEFLPVGGAEGQDVTSRAWKIHPDVIAQLQKGFGNDSLDDDPFADTDPFAKVQDSLARMSEERPLIDLMKESGIAFPEGAAVSYLPDSQVLVVKNTPSNMDLVDALMEMTAGALAQERQSVKANEKNASQEAFSTFSLNVSDVSFKLAQASLAKGEWPDAARVRVEEYVNAFDYGDPSPTQKEKVACQVEQAAHPFMQQRNMLRISMRTAALGRASGTPLRLTVLLDNSGSMERADRVESVQRAFQLLAAQLHPEDQITLISFARTPRLLRDRVPGDKAMELARVIAETPSEGGTNLEQALRLGIEKATERMLEGAQNRIILLTDGAANLGNAEPEELAGLVEQMRNQGISFDACGVGAEGLNDDVLEALTRKGDGRYYFLNRPEDADAGFAKQIAGALRPAAKNVKVQVEFNPKRVGHYRLYGFEKHILKKEDFRNDSVDAAELAAEEAGVAMYQVEPLPDGEGDIGTVSVRFQDMATGEMVEKLWPIPYEVAPARLAQAAPTMQLAASAAFLGEKLKGSPIGEVVELGELSGLSRGLQTVYPSNERVGHLVDMIEKARAMTR